MSQRRDLELMLELIPTNVHLHPKCFDRKKYGVDHLAGIYHTNVHTPCLTDHIEHRLHRSPLKVWILMMNGQAMLPPCTPITMRSLASHPYQTYVPHDIPQGYFPTTPAPHPGYIPSPYAPPRKLIPPTYAPPGGNVPPAYGFIPPTFAPAPVPTLVPAPSAPPSLRGFHRRGTTDWEPKKGTKRTRYYVPMRAGKKILDEESGFASPAQHLPEADRRSLGIPPGSEEDAVHDQIDVLATQCIPDIEGREIISLTVKDKSDSTEHKDQRYESRWRHVRSRNLELDQLWSHVSNMAWIEADDRALVARLLKKVEKTCEKTFVHGKCLKPVTLVYSGEDPNDTSKDIGKTAMFVSLPIFWLDFLPQQSFAQNSPGHPSRALLQTRCRLESTRRREKEQVITKSGSVQGVIHVPQIWVLIINNYTAIIYAPFETSLLCQSNIKTISYSEARLDEAKWSIRFENLEGNAFHLPLRLCRTWFGLVKHVSSSCPHYARTADGVTVRAENWPAMVLEKKAEIIHLKLIMNEVPFYGQDNQVNSEDRSKPDILTTDAEVQVNENDSLHVAEVDLLMDAMSQLTHQGKANTPAIETLASELGIDGYCDPDPIHSRPSLSAKPGSTFATPTIPQRKKESSTPPSQPQLSSSTSHSRSGKAAKTALSNFDFGAFDTKDYLEKTENSEQTRKSTSQLKKLVKIALKEVSHDGIIETQPDEEPTRVEKADIKQLPIFLWPAEHTPSDINQTSIDSEDRTQLPSEKDGETIAADMEHQSNTAHHREERRLHDILKGIHRQLLKPFRPAPSERLHAIQYDIIEDKTAPQVSLLLQKMQEKAERDTNQIDPDASTAFLVSKSIRTYSQKIINALVPEDCEEPVIAKYWGAVYRLLAERDCNSLRSFSNGLAALWTSICNIQTEIQSEDETKQPRYRIPPALPAAFQYLVMFFVLASSPSHESAAYERYRCCQSSLIEAKRQLVSMIHTLDYGGRAGFEAVNYEALVGLAFSNLLSRISPNGEYDLTEIYSEYTTKLQIMVRDKASVKVY
ncbi:hypothetical protein JMJ35_004482 [Cladonia borealis]|uniref:Uncharacterized protein n=1 Tax=Cladonia borealis TaxID=184061 RepID=A0AA39R3P5_9LECA|nr:hypothetical protein JMJ35_004482 [Cladonia borealis]